MLAKPLRKCILKCETRDKSKASSHGLMVKDHDQEVPGTVYWMDVSDPTINMKITKIKVAEWGTQKNKKQGIKVKVYLHVT